MIEEFKQKFEAVLKEHSIEESAAKAITELFAEAVKSIDVRHEEQAKKEEAETVEAIRENVKKLKAKHEAELTEEKKSHATQIKTLHESVKKLIAEDYEIHKKNLTSKVKVFCESKVLKLEEVIRENIEKEVKAQYEPKLRSISEAVQPYFVEKKEVKPVKVDNKLQEEVSKLKEKVNNLLAEKVSLESKLSKASKELNEEINKPLKEKINKPKISEVVNKENEDKKVDEAIEKETAAVIYDVIRLSGGYRQKAEVKQ